MEAPFSDARLTVWTLARPHDLLWRDWDDSGAVYDAGSGSTHVLNALGMEMLSLLMAAPRTQVDVLNELVGDMPDSLDADEIGFEVGNQLRQLQLLGLAVPATIAA